MILILTGTSSIARTSIAETLCKKHADWKHIPSEQIAVLAGHHGIELSDQPLIMITLAYECAKEMKRAGFSSIITTGDSEEILEEARKDFSRDTFLISLGEPTIKNLFDTSIVGSINDAIRTIEAFIDSKNS